MICATLLTASLFLSAPAPQDGEAAPPKGKIEFFKPSAAPELVAESSVGMRVEIKEFVIPGSAVRAKPVEDPGRAVALVRIKHEYNHGTGFRYDIEITPFVEGELDLRDFLERKDGTSMDDAPEMPILVEAMLDAAVLEPKELEVPQPDNVGGYRNLLIAAGAAWVLGLLALVFVGRRKSQARVEAASRRPVTLADRLRPLVEDARKGELSSERQAELERVIVAHWRKRRDLESVPAAQAVSMLRSDEESGPLLRQLEAWLHRPAGAGAGDAVDLNALLAPYENISAPEPIGAGTSGGAAL